MTNRLKKICTIDGCDNKHSAHGYCNMHTLRYLRQGKPQDFDGSLPPRPVKAREKPTRAPKKACSVDGCTRDYYGKGYCQKHYNAYRYHNEEDHRQRRIKHSKERIMASMAFPQSFFSSDMPITEITYSSMHGKIKMHRGRASNYLCVCGLRLARDWAYNNAGGVNERAGSKKIQGRVREMLYSVDIWDYTPLCRECHRQFDLKGIRPTRVNHGEVIYRIPSGDSDEL